VGAAVFVENTLTAAGTTASGGASFTMKGGEITRHATNAVYLRGNAAFSLNGGSITKNGSAAENGGAVILSGGTMGMTAGEVSGNRALAGGGIFMAAYTPGDGVEVVPSLEIKGGTIKDNSADRGGGIFVASGTLTHTNGTITANTAIDGGGVYVVGDSCRISDGAVISTNKASQRGGGVFLVNGDALTKQGGMIFGGTVEDVAAWVDLANSAGDGVSHALFIVSPSRLIAATIPNTEDFSTVDF
jgi:uncharacterized Zn-binding protein involved in type VI secretion